MASGKRLWGIVRAVCLTLRKGLAKRRIAAAQLLSQAGALPSISCCWLDTSTAIYFPNAIEFSCSSTPLEAVVRRKRRETLEAERDFEIFSSMAECGMESEDSALAALVRVSDSAFPLRDDGVDWAAEEFIRGFYEQLRRQNFAAKSPMLEFR